jgi:ABC-type phosphate transport system substrate-binding protein
MRELRTLFIVFALCAAGAVRLVAASADVKVIVNPAISAVSTTSAEIKAVFLETKTSLSNGSRVQPVILNGSTCEAFARSYLGKSAAGLGTYYRELVFSGTGVVPKMLSSDGEVVAYVSKTKGAIAYVSSEATTNGVKVLAVR